MFLWHNRSVRLKKLIPNPSFVVSTAKIWLQTRRRTSFCSASKKVLSSILRTSKERPKKNSRAVWLVRLKQQSIPRSIFRVWTWSMQMKMISDFWYQLHGGGSGATIPTLTWLSSNWKTNRKSIKSPLLKRISHWLDIQVIIMSIIMRVTGPAKSTSAKEWSQSPTLSKYSTKIRI